MLLAIFNAVQPTRTGCCPCFNSEDCLAALRVDKLA
jgi:hypothetical protein